MARIENSVRNLKYSIISFVLQNVLKFVARTVFINFLFVELLGLNTLFSNILSLLSLIELGFGAAISFSMYKPAASGDIETIKSLNRYYKKIYFITMLVVFVLGIVLIPFFPVLINDYNFGSINIYIIYFIFLFNTCISYVTANRRALLTIFQRDDVQSKIGILTSILLYGLQIAMLFLFKSYYLYIVIFPLITIIEMIAIYVQTNKMFPYIKEKAQPLDEGLRKEISTNTVALLFHKVGGTVVYATDSILISSMVGIAVLGIYSNYYIIISALVSGFSLLSNAVRGSVGNIIASGEKEYVYTVFKRLNFVLFWLLGFCAICLFILYQPFVSLWLSSDYLLPYSTVILIVISFYLNVSKTFSSLFKECAGLMKQDKIRPLIEAVVNLVASVILGKYMGLNGIILGTIISTVTGPMITEIYVLYKHYFKKSWLKYYPRILLYIATSAVVFILTHFVCELIAPSGIISFVIKGVLCVLIPNFLMAFAYFATPEFKYYWGMVINFFKKRKKNKSKEKEK